jgi:AcrR family transcriptional regulator
MADGSTLTPRAQARLETIEQIKQIAREHLAVDGPNGLSLRAVARDLGVVSSAVYRYFASRDELLTALIIDGYTALADAVEAAESAVSRRDLAGRWNAIGRAAREWALENQHEYALLYGTPVPGYEAPQETIEPANRPVLLAAAVLRDGVARGVLETPSDRLPKPVRADLDSIRADAGFDGLPAAVLGRALSMWALLFGTISFELFGRFKNGITDFDAYFEHQLKVMTRYLGLSK